MKGVRSQFSLRSIAENAGPKNRSKRHASDKGSVTPSPSPSPSPSSPLGILEFSPSSTAGTTFSSSSGSTSFAQNSEDSISRRNSRKTEINLLATVKEYESEKTISQSVDSFCSTPSSRERRSSRIKNMSKLEEQGNDTDEYGIKILRGPKGLEYKDDDDNDDDDDTIHDRSTDKRSRRSKNSDYKEDKDDIDDRDDKDSGLEKFFVKPASEFIVDFYDAFSNIDDGGVALMMEYMDGKDNLSCLLCYVISSYV